MPKAVRRTLVLATTPVALVALLGAGAPPSTGSSGAGDPYFPLAGNGGYHVDHYDLTLGYDPGSGRLDGKAVLTARAGQRLGVTTSSCPSRWKPALA